jgi:hypothetical protein
MKMAIYLDPVGANNGALRVVPGSHKMGDTFAEEAVHALMGHPRKDPKLMPDDADGMAEFIAAYMRKRAERQELRQQEPDRHWGCPALTPRLWRSGRETHRRGVAGLQDRDTDQERFALLGGRRL